MNEEIKKEGGSNERKTKENRKKGYMEEEEVRKGRKGIRKREE